MTTPSSITINGVPATISRKQFIAMIESLGVDPLQLTHLEFGYDAIVVELKVHRPDGKLMLDPIEANRIARHRITIPIVDEQP